MFIEAGQAFTALEVGSTLFDNRAKIRQAMRRLVARLTKGEVRIAVFGAGGAGKTTLGHVLAEGGSKRALGPYSESIEAQWFPLGGDFVGGLLVPPGQERRAETHWPKLYDLLAHGRSCGVINVVSYGYLAFQGFEWQEMPYAKRGMTPSDFVEVYTQARRERELELLDEIVPHLKTARDGRDDLWMITLVTKQDLWWDKRREVQNYYEGGAYNQRIQAIAEQRGKGAFRHEYVSASLVMSNFVSGSGELLAPTTQGYDQNIQQANLEDTIKTIHTLCASRKRR